MGKNSYEFFGLIKARINRYRFPPLVLLDGIFLSYMTPDNKSTSFLKNSVGNGSLGNKLIITKHYEPRAVVREIARSLYLYKTRGFIPDDETDSSYRSIRLF